MTAIDVVEAIERALALSKADACMVIGRRLSSANVRWAGNTVTTNGVADDAALSIVSLIGRRVGSVSQRSFTQRQVEELVGRSEAACRCVADAPDYMPLLEADAEPGDWRAPPVVTDIHVFDALAPGLGSVFERARRSNLQTFGFAEHRASTVWLATSTGLRRRHMGRIGSVTLTAKTSDFLRSSWTGAPTEDFSDVDAGDLFDRVERRLAWSRRRMALPAGEYEVLLEPSCTADLAVAAYGLMARRQADEGTSPLSKPGGGTRIGERLFGPITMYSDPNEAGIPAAPFHADVSSRGATSVFDNGLPASRTEWVRDGEVRALVTPRYWAARVGAPGPVPYIDNLIVAGDGPTLSEMIANTERALLVTCFWYMRTVEPRVALLTGLTRDGVYLVEGGEVKGAVNDFRWSMSPMTAFARTTEVGRCQTALARDHDSFIRAKAPPVRVERFTMSAAADASIPL